MIEIEFAQEHLVPGTRGPSMAVVYRRGANEGTGTIFFHECPGGEKVETLADALAYVAANLDWINSQLASSSGPGKDRDDTPVVDGWKRRRPGREKRADEIEQLMMQRAKAKVGWA